MVSGGCADATLGEGNVLAMAVQVRKLEDVECLLARVPTLITLQG